jgi:hypothetical protein
MRVVRVTSEGIFRDSELGAPGAPVDAPFPPAETDDGAPELPVVMVTWHDAWFDFDQTDPDDCRTDYLVRTVGFLLSDGPRFVSVAQEMLPDGDGFRAVTHIPVPIIESVTVLADTPLIQHG